MRKKKPPTMEVPFKFDPNMDCDFVQGANGKWHWDFSEEFKRKHASDVETFREKAKSTMDKWLT